MSSFKPRLKKFSLATNPNSDVIFTFFRNLYIYTHIGLSFRVRYTADYILSFATRERGVMFSSNYHNTVDETFNLGAGRGGARERDRESKKTAKYNNIIINIRPPPPIAAESNRGRTTLFHDSSLFRISDRGIRSVR